MNIKFGISKVFLFIVIIGLIVNSCSYTNEKYISEGVITFDAEVINKDHPLAGLAPSEMTTHFKNNHFLSEMSTMGIFVSKFITNPDNKTFISMVKIFDVKNALIENEQEISAFCARRRAADPDLWIVELDIADAAQFAVDLDGKR